MNASDTLIYLDNAATTPMDPEVHKAMLPHLGPEFANPSSVHRPGVRIRQTLEMAREKVLAALGGGDARLVFTSGGTEANNLAILGLTAARQGRGQILLSAVEHPSSHAPAVEAAARHNIPLQEIRVDRDGVIDLNHLSDLLSEETQLVGLIHGQNEIGVVQPVAEAAALVRERAPRALFHVDAVQSFGKIPMQGLISTVDSLSISGHKIHGPKGVGALLLKKNLRPRPVIHGGGQEGDIRSGTENVACIVGLGRAAELICEGGAMESTSALHDRVVEGLETTPDCRILGKAAPRLGTIVSAVIEGVRGEVLQHHLEEMGVIIGTGSACHAKRNKISPTYAAVGLNQEESLSVIRISLSKMNTEEDIDTLLKALPQTIHRIREVVR